MYVVVVVLSKAGDQAPEIPLVEVDGNAAKTAPLHIAGTAVKVGVTVVELIVIVKVAVVAH